MRLWGCLALLVVMACGGEAQPVPETTSTGGGGEAGAGGVAQAPTWGPSWTCQPGELELDDGTCQPAGIPALLCGDYFESDGDGSCVAVLPDAPCAPGTMAVPGETACREVAPCSGGKWGAAPIEVDTQFVDQAYLAGDGDGTQAKPWPSIQEGVDAAASGAVVAVAAGTYVEAVTIANKSVRLWGRCPAEVEITSAVGTVVELDDGADGSELHDMTIAGGSRGVEVTDATNVLLERIHLHDNGTGIQVMTFDVPSDVTMRGALVEGAQIGAWIIGSTLRMEESVVARGAVGNGQGLSVDGQPANARLGVLELSRVLLEQLNDEAIVAYGADMLLADVVVRDIFADNDSVFGALSLHAMGSIPERPLVVAERLIIERSGAAGLSFLGVDADLSAVAIRDSEPGATTALGDGIYFSASLVSSPPVSPELTLRFATLDRLAFAGISVLGANATLEGVRVRDVEAYHVDGSQGRGIGISASNETLLSSTATIRGCVVERATEGGIVVLGSTATIEGAAVRDIAARPSDDTFGRGIAFELGDSHPVSGSVAGSLVERVFEVGIGVTGGDLHVEDCAVYDVASSAGSYGVCMLSQMGLPEIVPSALTISDAEVARCEGFGVLVTGSHAEIARTTVREARENPRTMAFGDGLAVVTAIEIDEALAASATARDVVITESARAGIANFGAAVAIEGVHLACNTIQMNGEPLAGTSADFDDGGGNACVCAEEERACKVLSETLEAPQL